MNSVPHIAQCRRGFSSGTGFASSYFKEHFIPEDLTPHIHTQFLSRGNTASRNQSQLILPSWMVGYGPIR
jgi:hypothetical protein